MPGKKEKFCNAECMEKTEHEVRNSSHDKIDGLEYECQECGNVVRDGPDLGF